MMASLNSTINSVPIAVTAHIRFTRRFSVRLWFTLALLRLAARVAPFQFQVSELDASKDGEVMAKNKVHFGAPRGTSKKRYALCGADAGLNTGKVVPTSKEWRDVTCKNCKRMNKKGR